MENKDLDSQLLDAIEDLRNSHTTEWEAKKVVVLELFSKDAKIQPHILENLETYLGDLDTKIPQSVKEICDLLKEMCEGGYNKSKTYFKLL